MATRQYVQDTCELICEDNGKKFVVDVMSFQHQKFLEISLERSVKIGLKWNGKIYEGFMGGKSFVSDGPTIQNVRNGR